MKYRLLTDDELLQIRERLNNYFEPFSENSQEYNEIRNFVEKHFVRSSFPFSDDISYVVVYYENRPVNTINISGYEVNVAYMEVFDFSENEISPKNKKEFTMELKWIENFKSGEVIVEKTYYFNQTLPGLYARE